jgi:hypothetical protein
MGNASEHLLASYVAILAGEIKERLLGSFSIYGEGKKILGAYGKNTSCFSIQCKM